MEKAGKGISMRISLEGYETGWFGVKIALKDEDIDRLIKSLLFLKNRSDPETHFHISNSCEDDSRVADIEFYTQLPEEETNASFL